MRKRKAILREGFLDERWKNLEGLVAEAVVAREFARVMARLKRVMSSSSSEGEIGREWGLGGRILGARKKRIGRERRREKVNTNGVENIEFGAILN